MTHTCNIGIRPLGRGPEGASPVVLAEIAALRKWGKALGALGPITSTERAKELRRLMVEHARPGYRERLIEDFRALGYDW